MSFDDYFWMGIAHSSLFMEFWVESVFCTLGDMEILGAGAEAQAERVVLIKY